MIQVLALSQVTPPCASEVIHSHVLWRKNANAPRTVAFGGGLLCLAIATLLVVVLFDSSTAQFAR
jgi:hypothetical protein